MTGSCLDDDLASGYASGELSPEERARVEAHIDTCPDCLALVCEAARGERMELALTDTAPAPGIEAPDAVGLGEVAGRYTLVRLLGQGGMGAVYEAHDPKLERRVAVKVVRADRRDAPEARARMTREARAMAKLAHPHVVRVYDTGEIERGVFIAMELIDGAMLSDWLFAEPRSWRAVLDVFLAAARGLAAAHDAGIVHRDFKPDNVLIDRDGRVVVTDFGLATEPRATEGTPGPVGSPAGDDAATLTQTGTRMGTPRFMSPEQHEAREVDALSDQFSFGVALYEALYRAWPFPGETLVELREAVVHGDARRPSGAAAAAVPPAVEPIVMRALARDPSARFPSLHKMVAALEAGAAPAAPPIARAGRRRWAAATLVGLAIAGLAAARGLGHGPTLPVPAAPSATASGPVLVTDLPLPASSSAEALAAYRRGVAAQRAGTLMVERKELLAATAADPEMAKAWLRLAITQTWSRAPQGGRESYRKAAALRPSLDEHDLALLDAFEPVVLRTPLDFDEHARRLASAVNRFPRDAELAGAYAYALYRGGRWSAAIAAYDAAIALDPGQAEQFRFAGMAHAYLGDIAGAEGMAAACEKACPDSGMCPMLRASLSQGAGDCATFEREARATTLKTEEGFSSLAEALASQGRPIEAIREALRLDLKIIATNVQAFHQANQEVLLALYAGDFGAVPRLAAEAERLASDTAVEEEHAVSASGLVQAYLEMGKPAEARRAAEGYLARRASWNASGSYTYGGLWGSVLPWMFEALVAGGAPRDAVDAQREAFARDWAAKLPIWAHAVWFPAYAAGARSEVDARAAMAALPGYEPLPFYRGPTLWTAHEGRVRWLAGDPRGGRALLERGAGACVALKSPVERVRAQLDLGGVREADGDRDGACQAYGGVLSRWGAARPRSITADRARARVAALGCAPATAPVTP